MKTLLYIVFMLLLIGVTIVLLIFFDAGYVAPATASFKKLYVINSSFTRQLFNQAIENLKQPTSLLILQILVILLVSRLTAYLFGFIGQPAVMGETIGGILLGPSLAGALFPEFSHFLFPPDSLGRLQSLSQLGLVVYMFIVGMEIDFDKLKAQAGDAMLIGLSGIIFPFLLGVCISTYLYGEFCLQGVGFVPFALFIGVAMSITAFPVLARIVKEKKLGGTPIGTISISSAAIEDVTAWSLLAFVIAVAKSTSVSTSLISLLMVLLFLAIMLFIVKPVLQKYEGILFNPNQPEIYGITFIVAILLICAIITDVLGVHAVFGAFIAGLVMPVGIKQGPRVKLKLDDFTSILLLPVFFALTGLKTSFALLNTRHLWYVFSIVFLVAVAGKFIGVIGAGRIRNISWRNSFILGVLMNTRGLMELIALNIGYDLGVISDAVFTLMVLMAIITTFITGPLLSIILSKESFNTYRE